MAIQKYYQRNKEKYLKKQKEYVNTLKGRYTDIKKNAKYRDKEFSLTFDECVDLWSKECNYCGINDDKLGIDRVNSSLGYTIDNVVSCCSVCNYMKLNMSVDKFIERCYMVIEHSIYKENK